MNDEEEEEEDFDEEEEEDEEEEDLKEQEYDFVKVVVFFKYIYFVMDVFFSFWSDFEIVLEKSICLGQVIYLDLFS